MAVKVAERPSSTIMIRFSVLSSGRMTRATPMFSRENWRMDLQVRFL
jgi:hypothetical protein